MEDFKSKISGQTWDVDLSCHVFLVISTFRGEDGGRLRELGAKIIRRSSSVLPTHSLPPQSWVSNLNLIQKNSWLVGLSESSLLGLWTKSYLQLTRYQTWWQCEESYIVGEASEQWNVVRDYLSPGHGRTVNIRILKWFQWLMKWSKILDQGVRRI